MVWRGQRPADGGLTIQHEGAKTRRITGRRRDEIYVFTTEGTEDDLIEPQGTQRYLARLRRNQKEGNEKDRLYRRRGDLQLSSLTYKSRVAGR